MSDTFVQACLRGKSSLEDVDDWVDRWHQGASSDSLASFLGMTPAEYSLWVKQPSTLRSIVDAHRAPTDVSHDRAVTPILAPILMELEGGATGLEYWATARRFQVALEELGDAEHPDKALLRAECIAFSFVEGPVEQGERPTYFRPQYSATDANGVEHDFPPLSSVETKVIAHWSNRARTTRNPFLKARYADLVWDFSKPATGQKPDVAFARMAIDASVAAAQAGYFKYEISAIARFKRALDLSLSLRDTARIQNVVAAMIALEDKIAQDRMPGLWGFAFESIVLAKVAVEDSVRDKLVTDMEQRLDRMALDSRPDPSSMEPALERLLTYYRRTNSLDDQKRIIRKYAGAVRRFAEQVPPLMASSWLDSTHELLDSNGLRQEADQLALQMRSIESQIAATFKETSAITISIADFDAALSEVLDRPLPEVLERFGHDFVVGPDDAERQLQELAREHPILAMIGVATHDADGRKVAEAGSVEDDIDGRIAMQMGGNLQVAAPLLRHFIARMWKAHSLTTETILTFLGTDSIFPTERHYVIKMGLEAYEAGDYHAASCVLLPELEVGLRRLLHLQRGSIYRRAKNGGTNLRSLGEILREPPIAKVLGDRVVSYLRILLTDTRGWNLRNQLCHGLINPSDVAQPFADRVLHVLILLSCVRLTPPAADAKSSASGALAPSAPITFEEAPSAPPQGDAPKNPGVPKSSG